MGDAQPMGDDIGNILGACGTYIPWGMPWVTKGEQIGLFVGHKANILGVY